MSAAQGGTRTSARLGAVRSLRKHLIDSAEGCGPHVLLERCKALEALVRLGVIARTTAAVALGIYPTEDAAIAAGVAKRIGEPLHRVDLAQAQAAAGWISPAQAAVRGGAYASRQRARAAGLADTSADPKTADNDEGTE